jgi:glucose/arabinose dehydrogenase
MLKTNPSPHFIRSVALFTGAVFTSATAFAEPRAMESVVAERVTSTHHDFRVVQLAGGLEHPWSVAWLPDGSMLISERAGRLLHFDGSAFHQISGLPVIHADENQRPAPRGGRQGGLLDIVLHPDFDANGWIYFTFSSPGDPDSVVTNDRRGTGTALARARLDAENHQLVDLAVLYAQEPRSAPGRHYGSRIVFPGDGTVLFSIGDNGLRYTAQDLTHPAGSIIRLLEDGGAAPDNPLIGMAPGNLRPEIFSFGHRNNQGLAIDPQSGAIWATDHGPRGGDLLYRIERGANFGWPQVSFGTEYSTDAHIGIGRTAPGVTPPAHIWEASKGPSGLTFYQGDAFPAWRGNLFAGFLLRESVHRIVLDGDIVTEEEPLLSGLIGRIRDVREGPDGLLYFLTDEGDGGLFRIEPLSR